MWAAVDLKRPLLFGFSPLTSGADNIFAWPTRLCVPSEGNSSTKKSCKKRNTHPVFFSQSQDEWIVSQRPRPKMADGSIFFFWLQLKITALGVICITSDGHWRVSRVCRVQTDEPPITATCWSDDPFVEFDIGRLPVETHVIKVTGNYHLEEVFNLRQDIDDRQRNDKAQPLVTFMILNVGGCD